MSYCKCVLVGNEKIGKTSLVLSYLLNQPPENVPKIHTCTTTVEINDKTYSLGLWDTAGTNEYDRLRPLTYPKTDLFLVIFSVAILSSFVNVREKWIPELLHYNPGTPVILVGTQIDLREDHCTIQQLELRNETLVSYEQGLAMGEEIKAKTYLECSVNDTTSIQHVIHEAMSHILLDRDERRRNKSRCTLL